MRYPKVEWLPVPEGRQGIAHADIVIRDQAAIYTIIEMPVEVPRKRKLSRKRKPKLSRKRKPELPRYTIRLLTELGVLGIGYEFRTLLAAQKFCERDIREWRKQIVRTARSSSHDQESEAYQTKTV
jgi:hypothetical protein